jgi:hypothetical protein
MELIARNKVALVLYASEYAFFDEEPKTVSIQPLKLPSKKSILQMFLERVHHLALLCKLDLTQPDIKLLVVLILLSVSLQNLWTYQ